MEKTLKEIMNEIGNEELAGMSDTVTIVADGKTEQIELGKPQPYDDSKEYHPAVDIILKNGDVIKGEAWVSEKQKD